jgi:hypothetical protein
MRCLPNLEQNLWAHTEETIHYPKRKDHGHTINVPVKKIQVREIVGHKAVAGTDKLRNQGSEATDN